MRWTPERLARDLERDDDRLSAFNDRRREMIEAYAGRHYGGNAGGTRPVNLIAQYVDISMQHLVPPALNALVTPKFSGLEFPAYLLGLAIDHTAEEIGLIETIDEAIADALFGPLAIVKIGRMNGGDVVKIGANRLYDLGMDYVSLVDFEDWGIDPDARKLHEARWERHKYRLSREEAQESGYFDPDALAGVPAVQRDSESSSALSGDTDSTEAKEGDTIELCDIALYEQGVTRIVTVPVSARGKFDTKWLMEEEYEGPERGPYEHLSFFGMPNNAIPLSPVAKVADIAEACDRLANKGIRKELKAKTVGVGDKSNPEASAIIRDAQDGEMILLDQGASRDAKTLEYPGVGPQFYAMQNYLASMWNNIGGGLALVGGQSGPEDTATEAQIVAGNAQQRLERMKRQRDRFISRIYQHLGWSCLADPLVQLPLSARIDGGHMIRVQYDAATREGTANEFRFGIAVNTQPAMDPAVRQKRVVEMLDVLARYIPLAQMGGIDIMALARWMSRQDPNLKGIDEFVRDPIMAMMRQQAMGMVPQPTQGQATGPGGMGGRGAGMGAGRPQFTRPVDAARGARSFAGATA